MDVCDDLQKDSQADTPKQRTDWTRWISLAILFVCAIVAWKSKEIVHFIINTFNDHLNKTMLNKKNNRNKWSKKCPPPSAVHSVVTKRSVNNCNVVRLILSLLPPYRASQALRSEICLTNFFLNYQVFVIEKNQSIALYISQH